MALTAEQRQALEDTATATNCDIADIIRGAIELWMRDRERTSTAEKAPETWRQTMTPADFCRAQGWQVGDVLQSQEAALALRTTIVITAIGREVAFIWQEAGPGHEQQWDFSVRKWHKIGHMDPFADELVWP